MAKITIIFERASALPEGPETISYAVDEAFAPAFVAAIAHHDTHGKVFEQIMADTGQVDGDGKPILGPATTVRPATFREGLASWSNINVRDVILGAVNTFRRRKAEAEALAAVRVDPINVEG